MAGLINIKISATAQNALQNSNMSKINQGVAQSGNLNIIKLSELYSKYNGTEYENVYAVTNNGQIIGFTSEEEFLKINDDSSKAIQNTNDDIRPAIVHANNQGIVGQPTNNNNNSSSFIPATNQGINGGTNSTKIEKIEQISNEEFNNTNNDISKFESEPLEEVANITIESDSASNFPTEPVSSFDGNNLYLAGIECHSQIGDIGREKFTNYTEDDLIMMARMCENEATLSLGRDGYVAVAEEIRNRLLSVRFKNDIMGVLNDGYLPWAHGELPQATPEMVEICRNVLNGNEWFFNNNNVFFHASHSGTDVYDHMVGIEASKMFTATYYKNINRTQTFYTLD